ncbi:hypothetical protein BE11_45500 [Sorangium cellulosum]|nr:hypothetical protein BE11_45500 [Sorangium cellulosum]
MYPRDGTIEVRMGESFDELPRCHGEPAVDPGVMSTRLRETRRGMRTPLRDVIAATRDRER